MSSYINTILTTELTCIPGFLRKFIGDYYDSVVSNGSTWMFVAWCVWHWIFSRLFKALFKRVGCMGYINERLRHSIWYFSFYAGVLVYFGTNVTGGKILYAGSYGVVFHKNLNNLSNFLTIGYIGLISFYMHSTIWETFIVENTLLGYNYFLLVIATATALYIRSIDAVFRLSVLISVAHFVTELARFITLLANYDHKAVRIFVNGFFLLTLLITLFIYLVALPVVIIQPAIVNMIMKPTVSAAGFIIVCMVLLTVDVITSPIYRLSEHLVSHLYPEKVDHHCTSRFAECALFVPRNDVVFNINKYRQQVKEHREKMKSMVKPKNKNTLVQTIKSMLAVRRIMKAKKLPESSDSDESGKSESESRDEPQVQEEESDSEEESEQQEQADNEDGVLIQEVVDDDAVKDEEEIVDGKLEIRVKDKKLVKSGNKHPK